MKVQKYLILSVAAIGLMASQAFAQSSNSCTIQGHIYRPDGSPAAGETVHIIKVEQQGSPIAFTPFDVQADNAGAISFDITRNSEVWVQANNVDGLNVIGGVPLQVPDAPTASFEVLWHLGDGVLTFNGRAGDVTLNGLDISAALGYTPVNPAALTAYATLGGQPGGQTLSGGNQAGDALTLRSTSSSSKGKILFGSSGYDEAFDRLGIGTNAPADSIETLGHIRVGIEKGVRFQTQGTPFSIHVSSQLFNGTRDDVFYLAYNLLPGTVSSKIVASEPQLKFGLEANYNPGDHTQMEWNFDYVSADNTVFKRPLTFGIDRATHIADWTFSQRNFTLADNNGIAYANFEPTNGLTLSRTGLTTWGIHLDRRADSTGNNSYPAFRPIALNKNIEFGVMPNGIPSTYTSAAFSLWNTDFRSDQSNYERLAMYARKDTYSIQSEGVGTGIARPIVFQNNALVITPSGQRVAVGTVTPNSTLQVNGSFATNIVTKNQTITPLKRIRSSWQTPTPETHPNHFFRVLKESRDGNTSSKR